MLKNLQQKALLLLLVLVGGGMTASAEKVTDVLDQTLTGVTGTNYTAWSGKTSNSDAVYAGQCAGGNNAIQLRSNNSNSGIITTASGGKVKKVVVTWNSNTASGRTLNVYGKNTAYSAATDLYNSSNQGTLLGTIVNGTSTELTIEDDYAFIGFRSASGAMYLDKVEITWEVASATDPIITAEDVELAFDATNGTIAYSIENAVEGTTLTATTTAEWLTIGTISSAAVNFVATVNDGVAARTASVTLTYATVTKTITVTQSGDPNASMTISEVRAQATGNVVTKGIVTSCVGRTAYIQDANAAICVYGTSNLNLTVGDEIRVSGSLTTFNGLLEITNSEYTTLSTGNTIEPEAMTVAQVNESTKQGWLVKVTDALVRSISGSNVTVEQDESNVVVRFGSADDINFETGNKITFTANIGCYNTLQLVNPADVSHKESQDGIITLGETKFSVPVDGTDEGSIPFTAVNIEEFDVYFCNAQGETATYDWIAAEINDENNAVNYVVDANTGDERTAYLKIYGLDAEANEIYSSIITITQAKYISITDGIINFADFAEGCNYGSECTHYNAAAGTHTWTAGNVTFALSGRHALYNHSQLRLYKASGSDAAGTIAITAGNEPITKIELDRGSNDKITTDGYSDGVWEGNATSVVLTVSDRTDINKITVTYGATTITATIGDAKWATYVAAGNVSFPTSCSAYIATAINETSVTLTEVLAVAEGTPVVLNGEQGEYELEAVEAADCDNVDANMLRVVSADKAYTIKSGVYVLTRVNGTVGFYAYEGTNGLPEGRVYLQPKTASQSRNFLSLGNSEATGIVLNNAENGMSTEVFDLQGRRVEKVLKGLYIVNGKKMIIK